MTDLICYTTEQIKRRLASWEEELGSSTEFGLYAPKVCEELRAELERRGESNGLIDKEE